MFDDIELTRYLLVPWPYSQQVTELPNWEDHTIIATNESDVGECYLVEESWFEGVTETMRGL